MTANAMDSDRQACLAAGMDDYISKPIQVRELRAALERASATDPPPVPRPSTPPSSPPAPRSRPTPAPASPSCATSSAATSPSRSPPSSSARPTTIASLADAVAAADPDRLREAAHSLKGSAGGMHLEHLHQLASALELRGRAGTTDGTAALVDELERQFLRVQEVFELQLRAAETR
jgi:two-component system sensor histidine kinase/response regulator